MQVLKPASSPSVPRSGSSAAVAPTSVRHCAVASSWVGGVASG